MTILTKTAPLNYGIPYIIGNKNLGIPYIFLKIKFGDLKKKAYLRIQIFCKLKNRYLNCEPIYLDAK